MSTKIGHICRRFFVSLEGKTEEAGKACVRGPSSPFLHLINSKFEHSRNLYSYSIRKWRNQLDLHTNRRRNIHQNENQRIKS
jgi:hypothetical protein